MSENYVETPTVGDLIKELSKFPPDAPVLATWEGVFQRIGVEKELYEGVVIILAEEVGEGRRYFGDYGCESLGNKGHGWYG